MRSNGLVNRRRFLLQLGVVGGALLATGSVVAFFRTRGYAIAPERERSLLSLSAWQLIVVEQAARRMAASDESADVVPTTDETDVAGFIDAYGAKLPEDMRRDLFRFFAYLEHLAPLCLQLGSRFSRLAPADQDRVLASLETSDMPLLRAGFQGLKALVFMGYYRDPRTWRIAGYPGPWLNRPEGAGKERDGG
ncbi:gluconate 2-dehydrogenase subunit 3 family protein [Pendulispora albinea]|uniref:Gluconate 2-dehydrogenase subunit 3 family protein n=1 Tax=Pendulispora albinea TaxID=2741071 RepID=A0ABZ2M9T1_9BACT